MALTGLTRRADFLAAARAARTATPAFVLQARRRPADQADPHLVRVGFTCSKKVGNAVARNRAKRRLRALAQQILPGLAHPGWDYVLIGRKSVTADRPFDQMSKDLQTALAKIHKSAPLHLGQNTPGSGAAPQPDAQ